MNNENEKIIGLLSKINAAQNEMIAAISHRSGHTAEDTAALLQLFDAGNTGRISAELIPESLKKESMVEIKADGSAVLTGKGNEYKPRKVFLSAASGHYAGGALCAYKRA